MRRLSPLGTCLNGNIPAPGWKQVPNLVVLSGKGGDIRDLLGVLLRNRGLALMGLEELGSGCP